MFSALQKIAVLEGLRSRSGEIKPRIDLAVEVINKKLARAIVSR